MGCTSSTLSRRAVRSSSGCRPDAVDSSQRPSSNAAHTGSVALAACLTSDASIRLPCERQIIHGPVRVIVVYHTNQSATISAAHFRSFIIIRMLKNEKSGRQTTGRRQVAGENARARTGTPSPDPQARRRTLVRRRRGVARTARCLRGDHPPRLRARRRRRAVKSAHVPAARRGRRPR